MSQISRRTDSTGQKAIGGEIKAVQGVGTRFFVALGALVLALTFAGKPAEAIIMNFGDLEVTLDTNVTAGVSFRAADRENKFLPVSNGGPRENSVLNNAGFVAAAGAFSSFTSQSAAYSAVQAYRGANAGNEADAVLASVMSGFTPFLGGTATTVLAGVRNAATLTPGNTAAQTAAVARLTAALTPIGTALGTAFGQANTNEGTNPCGTADGTQGLNLGSNTVYNQLINGRNCSRYLAAEHYNYDDSINTDDGRLNFDNGDLISGSFKITPEMSASFGDWRGFIRINAFYDVLLDQSDSFERAAPGNNTKSDMVRHVDLLDAYISKDGEFLGNPYTIKVGRQVINWGESTFVLGGNSVFNPIDVGALRRPGSEIKEGFIPVEAVSSTMFLPGSLTLEGYYGDWERYKLDRGGYPFSAGDLIGNGGTGGSRSQVFISGGLFSGGAKLNCDVHGSRLAAMINEANGAGTVEASASSELTQAIYKAVYDAAKGGGKTGGGSSAEAVLKANGCFVDPATDDDETPLKPGVAANIPYTKGQAEKERFGYDDAFIIKRFGDENPGYGNWGTAMRWYSELLNSTEFGLYFQNYHSRIPYISIASNGPQFGYGTVAPNSSTNGRVLFDAGCGTAATLALGVAQVAEFARTVPGQTAIAGLLTTARTRLENTALNTVRDNTVSTIVARAKAAADAKSLAENQRPATAAEIVAEIGADNAAVAAALKAAIDASLSDTAKSAITGGITAAQVAATAAQLAATGAGIITATGAPGASVATRSGQLLAEFYNGKGLAQKRKSQIKVADPLGLANHARAVARQINPAYTYQEGSINNLLTNPSGSGELTLAEAQEIVCRSHLANTHTALGSNRFDNTGEMYFGIGFPLDIGFTYPENLKVFGGSFNTTLFGWGVQGEVAWRPDFPLQVDTDSLTIAGLVSGCAFENYGPAFTAINPDTAAAAAGDINAFLTRSSAGWRQDRIGCTDDYVFHKGYIEEDIMNWDIGTTATFTRSNPVVRLMGADLAILLTEFAGVWAPAIDKYKTAGADLAKNYYPLQNLCTTGTDIALAGVFSLDPRAVGDCRPTEHAMGMVLLGQLQYNNVLGTPFGLTPRLVWSYGIQGRAPIPAATWRKEVGAVSLGLDATYLSAWRATFSYVHYLADEDEIYSDNIDRNFVSLSLSYAF